ncbi:hypothetical protein [Streptomyces sp. NPDC090025]|uniref:hypothetical protein n=1 Tax=Streptomyces sp. NPDC090025 TaxID=3365922 RepID=UPI0038346254
MAEIVLTNTGLDAFLAAHPEFRAPGAGRAADAVLSLLALRGADRGSGLPEPAPALVKLLLVEDLPAFVSAAPADLAAYPAVLRSLAARFDGGLSQRVEAVLAENGDDFARAMADPGNLTWPRWYGQLLRADGTDPDDPEAVRAWLARQDRPPLPDGMRGADLMGRTAVADVVLAEVLTRAYVRDAERAPAAGPLLGDHDVAQGIGTVAAALLDRWTAAGLAEGLTGPYAHLAPGPDDFPHLVLADALLDEHLDYYGDPSAPLPPPETPPETDPGTAPGTDVPDLEHEADRLAETVDELADAPAPNPYGSEAAHLLYTLYQRGCRGDSVARRAAEFEDWTVDPALEDAPVALPPPASPGYTTPTVTELARLLGIPGLTDTDRARLDGPARELAAVVDRLAATGLVRRSGDAFGLTPAGTAVVRYLLAVRGVAVPDEAEVADWDAATLVAAASAWPPAVAHWALARHLNGRGAVSRPADPETAWGEVVAAVGTVNAGTPDAAATRALLDLFDWRAAPTGVLRATVTDPLAGAHAEQALRERGERTDPAAVPPAARALRLLDALPAKKGPLESRRTAFDRAAADWPGGSAALVATMTAADPHQAARVLRPLGIHVPDTP